MYIRIVFSLLAVLFLFNGVVDYCLYRALLKPQRNRLLIALHWSLSALFVLGIVSVSALFVFGNAMLHLMMWFMFFYFLVYIPKCVLLLFLLPGYLFIEKRRRSFHQVGVGAAVLVFFCFLYGLTIGRNSIRIESVALSFPSLPPAFDGLRVVHLSDLHLGNLGKRSPLVQQMVDETNALSPDMICITGDLVNSRSEELLSYKELLSQLKARFGVYYVLGNHDYSDYARFPSEEAKQQNFRQLLTDITAMGWHLLNNESRQVKIGGDSIAVVGVENWGEPPFSQHGDLEKALTDLSDSQFKILLSHNPEHWRKQVQSDSRIALTLSGHTHAMQFKLQLGDFRWSPAQYKYPMWGGLYRSDANKLYVNEGIGYVFIPFRLGTRPEITLITLE